MNTAWHEKVRNYRGHNGRVAWSLLGYTPHYNSFNTSRKVTKVDSVLHGEGSDSEPVTIVIPIGCLAESGDSPSAPIPDSSPVKTGVAEAGPSLRRRKKLVASSCSTSSNSEEEEKEAMLRHHRQRFTA